MAEQSVKDRVYAAAERISAERNPTVATVREAAGVSNADATRFLKEWRAERDSAGSKIAATPAAITEQALRLAGTVWEEAVRTRRLTGLPGTTRPQRQRRVNNSPLQPADTSTRLWSSRASSPRHGPPLPRCSKHRRRS